jgi:pimeloyl-ACP methyl ester carboxylesterase
MPLFHHQGQTLSYVLEPNLSSDDIVLIHGNLASKRWWQPTIDLLKHDQDEATMHGSVLAMDWPGCGSSLPPNSSTELSMEKLADAHIALIKAVGMSAVNVVGHSTGGLIALIGLLKEPKLFAKALLLDSVSAQGIQLAPEMIQAFSKMSRDRAFCEIVMGSTIRGCDLAQDFFQQLFNDSFNVDKMIWSEIPQALAQVDIRNRLAEITQPVLILHGEFDQVLPEAGSLELAKLISGAKYEKLIGRGHCANVEDPQAFVHKMTSFFASC